MKDKDTRPKRPAIETTVADGKQSRMTQTEIGWMLAVAARTPRVMAAAVDTVTASLFDSSEAPFVLLWRAVIAVTEERKGFLPEDPMVAKELVGLKCAAEVAGDPYRTYYTSAVERTVLMEGGILDEMFKIPINEDIEQKGIQLLAKFVTERTLADPLRKALAGLSPHETIGDPIAVLDQLERHVRAVGGLGNNPGSSAVVEDDDFMPPLARLVTTGIGWLDEFLGGGQRAGECYAWLGPSSGGKSALMTQIAVNGADIQVAMAKDVGIHEAGYWYYLSWELDELELRERIYAYGAKIHHDTYQKRQEKSSIHKPGSLKPYELDPYVNPDPANMKGEIERQKDLRARLTGHNDRLKIVDYSGAVPGQGLGGIREAAAYLRQEASNGKKPIGIVIDYAGLVVSRYVNEKGMDPSSEYPLLSSFVDTVRNQICKPLGCFAWVLHQLHGDAAKRAPGAKQHHSDARGCRNFADNSDFGFQMTKYNADTGLLRVDCTKHRRAAGLEQGAIIKFDGRFGAFMRPDQDYVVDPVTRQIVPKDYMDHLSPGPAHIRRNKPAGGVDPTDGI